MGKSVFLSPRLKTISECVGTNAKIIDVGTDHAYIPIYLAQNGLSDTIFASDINEGPLEAARRNAREYGVEERIGFLHTDGLNDAEALDIDTVIIAGMGGEVISGILERACWLRERNIRLILQPQSKICELANWLDNNGYAIKDAMLVKDTGRIYVVMIVTIGASRAPFTCAEMYADRLLMEKHDPLLPEYLDMLIRRFKRALEGMDSAREDVSIDIYDHTKLALRGFIKMREETKTWQM